MRIYQIKKNLGLIIFILILSNLYSQKKNHDYVSAYRSAIYYFDNQDYGKALTYSEDAITFKKNKSEYETKLLTSSLSSKAVKSAGNSIYNVIKVLERRNEDETVRLIKNYLKIKGEAFFEDSIEKMLSYISAESEYPEAQYLIGQIYHLEGEYVIAERYYNMALENKDVLDIPDFKYEILYNLAEISKVEKDQNKYEARLLNILIEDRFVSDTTLINSMKYTIDTNKPNSVERFFTLYRASEYKSIKAYNLLTDYYLDSGYLDKALDFASLSVITSFTKIYEVICDRNSNFTYSNLKSFFEELNGYSDIIEWGADNEIWKSFNVLARLSAQKGCNVFAQELLTILVKYSPQEYWQKEAVLQLENLY